MLNPETASALSEERRRTIFRALVDAQDERMSVPESRKVIAQVFGLSEMQVLQIEREGIAKDWPPLEGGAD